MDGNARPTCGGSAITEEEYDLPLHIAALCMTIGVFRKYGYMEF